MPQFPNWANFEFVKELMWMVRQYPSEKSKSSAGTEPACASKVEREGKG
jgi:hypothetical protein